MASCLNTRYTRRAAQRGDMSTHRNRPGMLAHLPRVFLSPLRPLRSLPDHSSRFWRLQLGQGGCPTVLLTVTLEEHHPQHHAKGVGVELQGAVPGHAAPVATQPGARGGQECQAQQLRHGHVRREPGGAGGRRGPVHGSLQGQRGGGSEATVAPKPQQVLAGRIWGRILLRAASGSSAPPSPAAEPEASCSLCVTHTWRWLPAATAHPPQCSCTSCLLLGSCPILLPLPACSVLFS